MSWPPPFKVGPPDGLRAGRRFGPTLLKALVSLGLLAYLFSKVDAAALGRALEDLRAGYFALAVAAFLLLQTVSIYRWMVIARAMGYMHGYGRLAVFYFAGLFFNLFLPTSIGGDLGRGYYLAAGRGDIGRAFITVLSDRVSGMIALMTIAAAAVLLAGTLAVPFWMSAATVGAAGALIAGLLAPFAAPAFFRRIGVPMRFWEEPRILVVSLLASFVIQLSVVGVAMLTGSATGLRVSPGFYFVFIPLVTVAGMIPVSLNGLGVREGAFVYFLTQAGASTEASLVFAMFWLALIVISSAVGGLVWIFASRGGGDGSLTAGGRGDIVRDEGAA